MDDIQQGSDIKALPRATDDDRLDLKVAHWLRARGTPVTFEHGVVCWPNGVQILVDPHYFDGVPFLSVYAPTKERIISFGGVPIDGDGDGWFIDTVVALNNWLKPHEFDAFMKHYRELTMDHAWDSSESIEKLHAQLVTIGDKLEAYAGEMPSSNAHDMALKVLNAHRELTALAGPAMRVNVAQAIAGLSSVYAWR